jgi:HIT domain
LKARRLADQLEIIIDSGGPRKKAKLLTPSKISPLVETPARETLRMDCIFCHPDRSILAETKLSFAFLDGFPVSKGHTLVVPKRHVASLWEMTTEEYTDAFALVRQVRGVLQDQFNPQGFNIGVNCGQTVGQTVFHAHRGGSRCLLC